MSAEEGLIISPAGRKVSLSAAGSHGWIPFAFFFLFTHVGQSCGLRRFSTECTVLGVNMHRHPGHVMGGPVAMKPRPLPMEGLLHIQTWKQGGAPRKRRPVDQYRAPTSHGSQGPLALRLPLVMRP